MVPGKCEPTARKNVNPLASHQQTCRTRTKVSTPPDMHNEDRCAASIHHPTQNEDRCAASIHHQTCRTRTAVLAYTTSRADRDYCRRHSPEQHQETSPLLQREDQGGLLLDVVVRQRRRKNSRVLTLNRQSPGTEVGIIDRRRTEIPQIVGGLGIVDGFVADPRRMDSYRALLVKFVVTQEPPAFRGRGDGVLIGAVAGTSGGLSAVVERMLNKGSRMMIPEATLENFAAILRVRFRIENMEMPEGVDGQRGADGS